MSKTWLGMNTHGKTWFRGFDYWIIRALNVFRVSIFEFQVYPAQVYIERTYCYIA